MLRNCCSVDFFILISSCVASVCKHAFLQCVPSYVIIICIVLLHNMDCLLSHALMSRSKSVMTNIFIFLHSHSVWSFFCWRPLKSCWCFFFFNVNAEHSHPIYLISMSHWHEHLFFVIYRWLHTAVLSQSEWKQCTVDLPFSWLISISGWLRS